MALTNFVTLLGIVSLFIQLTLGGLLQGVSYSPGNYNYGRAAQYQSPIIETPQLPSTYSARYTAYTAVPLTGSVVSPIGFLNSKQHVSGLVRAFPASSHFKHSGLSTPLIRQGISAYAAVPIAGYRVSLGGPSIRSYAGPSTSLVRSYPATLNIHQDLYPPPVGLDDYTDPIVNDQRNFGSFENENPISIW